MMRLQIISIQTFIATLLATSLMTIFSYVVSAIRKKKFREPELLNDLIRRLNQKEPGFLIPIAGWIIHYFVGLLFIIAYHLYWRATDTDPTFNNCIVLGAFSGLIGIFGWQLAFSIHPNPPSIDFKEFYIQLFFAHVIFGAGAFLSFFWSR